MTFRTMYTGHERKFSDPGSHFANDYEIEIDKRGHKILHFIGTHDQWEEIQSYKDECLIENILARAAAGDENILNQRQGAYLDISECPKDLAEAQRSIMKLNNAFEKLPSEIREKFDNSKEKFVMTYGSDEWLDSMGFRTEVEPSQTSEKITFDGKTQNEVLTPEA